MRENDLATSVISCMAAAERDDEESVGPCPAVASSTSHDKVPDRSRHHLQQKRAKLSRGGLPCLSPVMHLDQNSFLKPCKGWARWR